MVLRKCATDEDSMGIIEDLDGVRLIWSLLKNESPKVIYLVNMVDCLHFVCIVYQYFNRKIGRHSMLKVAKISLSFKYICI